MHNIRNFVGILTAVTLACGAVSVDAAQVPNPRGSSNTAGVRSTGATESNTTHRAATNTASRTTATRGNSGRVSARGAIMSGAMRGASGVARSATSAHDASQQNSTNANTGVSRAALSRATAVFSDVSKIGGGYAACRDAYATCMDQFCANANDKYRRCFCSSRYNDFADTEAALDQAKTLLMQFEDNNLNAVDKSADEVKAMYSATVGEAAIKKDTSGAAQILDQIGDLLSGKTKVSAKKGSTTSSLSSGSFSLNISSLDFNTDFDDVWSGSSSSGVFSRGGSNVNLSDLEGADLYNESNKQCAALVAETCSSDATLQMARSSYNIMISQDCNAYEKKIDSQKEAVKQTVRTAEKYLREARLEEYRSHNSADINNCIGLVKTAILADSACGPNYKRCLDYSGAYINQTTGDAIYTPRLFQLNNLITLDGESSDVLRQNQQFNNFLDTKRVFATTALDSCRSIADTVWNEFKRTALIEIAQAQDEKIEEVKMSCVSTMAQCYDTQTSSLKDFDTTTAANSGVATVVAARAMCQEKVIACASLYGDTTGCKFDGNGQLVSGKTGDTTRCGLTQLLNFVDSVDKTRVTEACDTVIDNYLKELCTPSSGKYGYPYNCRSLSKGNLTTNFTPNNPNDTDRTIYGSVARQVASNCNGGGLTDTNLIRDKVEQSVDYDLKSEMKDVLAKICEDTYSGVWSSSRGSDKPNEGFYMAVYGTKDISGTDWGYCLENSTRVKCETEESKTGANGFVTYDAVTNTCKFADGYYEYKCKEIPNAFWMNNVCYVDK